MIPLRLRQQMFLILVYLAAFAQGLAMVSFPASGSILKDMKGLSDGQYGFIFIPQLLTAIAGSLAGGGLVRRMGLKRLLGLALAATGLSQFMLGAAVDILPPGPAYFMILGATAMFGVAFGVGAAPLNTYPGLLFPRKSDAALVALHTLLGIGLAFGPLLMGILTKIRLWIIYPQVLTGVSFLLVLILPLTRSPVDHLPGGATDATAPNRFRPAEANLLRRPVFWGFLAVVILYAFAEGTFANWCVIYLYEERAIPLPEASLALSVFWAALAGGRLLASAALLKVKTEHLWLLPPFLMIGAFALMPSVETAGGGLWAFAFAGLACSAFFPLCIAVATKRFPEREAVVASLLIAALMLGVGIGSFAIGPLRAYLPLERLYFWSAVYPAGVLLAVVSIVTGGRHSRKCSPVLGKTC